MPKTVLIVGAGPAGLTAAIYLIRGGFHALVLEGNLYGGQVSVTPTVENYPGFQSIGGVEFSMKLYEHAVALGAEILFEQVKECDLTGEKKIIITDSGRHSGDAVIIANGAQRRKLSCPGEERLTGRGVSWCATCDGALYKEKTVAVIGGGNTAIEDALYLANTAKDVHLVHRRDGFRGEQGLSEQLQAKENVTLHLGYTVTEIMGQNTVEQLVLESVLDQSTKTLPIDGVFVAVGTKPDNGLYSAYAPLDDLGYFLIGEDCKTPTPGVFVAGDCRKKPLRQIVTATADGAVAATAAAGYLNSSHS